MSLRFITGDEVGLLKLVSVPIKPSTTQSIDTSEEKQDENTIKPTISASGRIDRGLSVQRLFIQPSFEEDNDGLSELENIDDENEEDGESKIESDHEYVDEPVYVWVARKNGSIECWDTSSWSMVNVFTGYTGDFVGLVVTHRHIIIGTQDGIVQYRDRLSGKIVYEVSIGKGFRSLAVHPTRPTVFAIGGEERDLVIYDIESETNKEPIFKARNVKNDWLDLRVPIFIRDIRFLSNNNNSDLVIASGKFVRVYDTTHGRRPVKSFQFEQFEDNPIKRLELVPGRKEAMLADNMGVVLHVSLETGKVLGRFKGIAGTVTDFSFDPSNPDIVACCGIDRQVRLYDLKSHKLLHKIYLKQRMNCIAMISDDPAPEEAHGSEDDDVWETMEVVTEGSRKRKLSDVGQK